MPWRSQAKKDVEACEKLRGAGKRAEIRRYPNGGTHLETGIASKGARRTEGTETSKYLQEKKSTEISRVAASEIESAVYN